MNTIPYRNPVVIPYEVQEFISAYVGQVHSAERTAQLLPVCFEALEHYVKGLLEVDLTLPEGFTFKGGNSAPVWLIVEEQGLDLFADEVRLANSLPLPDLVPLVDLIPPDLATQ